MTNFRRIGLLTRLHLDQVTETLNHLVRFLNGAGWQPVVEASAAEWLEPGDYTLEERDVMARSVDLVIVVGGDGSMLSAARDMVDFDVPLLGVNRGRLGFLTDILPDAVEERVTRVLAGEYVVSDRFLLDVSITRGNQLIGEGLALNDVVLHPGKSVRMMEFELHVDRQF